MTEETSQVKKEKDSDESVLPAIIKTETKSSKPIPPENEKPAFSPEPEDALSNLPELPQPQLKAVDDKSLKVERSVEEDKPKKKEGIFGRILGGKKKK